MHSTAWTTPPAWLRVPVPPTALPARHRSRPTPSLHRHPMEAQEAEEPFPCPGSGAGHEEWAAGGRLVLLLGQTSPGTGRGWSSSSERVLATHRHTGGDPFRNLTLTPPPLRTPRRFQYPWAEAVRGLRGHRSDADPDRTRTRSRIAGGACDPGRQGTLYPNACQRHLERRPAPAMAGVRVWYGGTSDAVRTPCE